MRLFGGERLQALMNSMGVDENMPIEAKLLSNSIQSAQARIEGCTSRCVRMSSSTMMS